MRAGVERHPEQAVEDHPLAGVVPSVGEEPRPGAGAGVRRRRGVPPQPVEEHAVAEHPFDVHRGHRLADAAFEVRQAQCLRGPQDAGVEQGGVDRGDLAPPPRHAGRAGEMAQPAPVLRRIRRQGGVERDAEMLGDFGPVPHPVNRQHGEGVVHQPGGGGGDGLTVAVAVQHQTVFQPQVQQDVAVLLVRKPRAVGEGVGLHGGEGHGRLRRAGGDAGGRPGGRCGHSPGGGNGRIDRIGGICHRDPPAAGPGAPDQLRPAGHRGGPCQQRPYDLFGLGVGRTGRGLGRRGRLGPP